MGRNSANFYAILAEFFRDSPNFVSEFSPRQCRYLFNNLFVPVRKIPVYRSCRYTFNGITVYRYTGIPVRTSPLSVKHSTTQAKPRTASASSGSLLSRSEEGARRQSSVLSSPPLPRAAKAAALHFQLCHFESTERNSSAPDGWWYQNEPCMHTFSIKCSKNVHKFPKISEDVDQFYLITIENFMKC